MFSRVPWRQMGWNIWTSFQSQGRERKAGSRHCETKFRVLRGRMGSSVQTTDENTRPEQPNNSFPSRVFYIGASGSLFSAIHWTIWGMLLVTFAFHMPPHSSPRCPLLGKMEKATQKSKKTLPVHLGYFPESARIDITNLVVISLCRITLWILCRPPPPVSRSPRSTACCSLIQFKSVLASSWLAQRWSDADMVTAGRPQPLYLVLILVFYNNANRANWTGIERQIPTPIKIGELLTSHGLGAASSAHLEWIEGSERTLYGQVGNLH